MTRPNLFPAALGLASLLALSGCVAPVGPVEVTRFHVADVAPLGRGTIAIEPAAEVDDASLEYRAYAAAVARQLVLLGYVEQAAGGGARQVALVRIERSKIAPQPAGGPVSVGVGGGTGSFGSGVGIGVGVNLSGLPPAQTATELSVTIRDRASGNALWEGRARFVVRSDSPLADTTLGSAKLAEALFKGFPGASGETIEVR
jgi:hypothetical protein